MWSLFLNLSVIKYWNTLPEIYLAISLIDVNGAINNKQQTLYLAAKYVAGPLPIDLPHRIIF